MKMFAMQSLLAVAALWLFPLTCTAMVMEMESEAEMESDEELVGSTTERSEKKEAFTPKECLSVVKKVQESGRYTEESIVPVCNDVMGRSSNCEFFAEALSLASSHTDFQGGETFCEDMDRAQFCSEIMDKLLQSTAVSDLAFGECERAKPQKNVEYCRRIQRMLGLSVKQEDLDTMRACYMMEAYTNNTQTGNKALEANEASPQMRIITGGNKELDGAGKGGGAGHPPNVSTIGKADIVLQPTPLANFGKGKGNITQPKNIITEAKPAGAAPAPAGPGLAAPAAAGPAGPILAEPIPAPAQDKSALQTSSSKVHPVAVAQAKIVNGTLVMTGTAFGNIKVDGTAIVDALRKQAVAVAPEQVLAIKQPTSVKAAPAAKPIPVPKQVATVKTTPVQPAKVKVGLLNTEPARIVVVNPPKPVAPIARPAVPVAQPEAASPRVAPSTVPTQQVIKIMVVTEPAQQQAVKPVDHAAPPPLAARPAAQQPSVHAVTAAPQQSVKEASVRVAPPPAHPAQTAAVAQPAAAAEPKASPVVSAQPVAVAKPAAAEPKVASSAVPAQQVIKIMLVTEPAQAAEHAAPPPPAARQGTPQPSAHTVAAAPQPPVKVAALRGTPPAAVPQAARPAAPQPAAVPQAARPAAPQVVAAAVKPPTAQAVAQPPAALVAVPKPSIEAPVAQVVVVPVAPPALKPAAQPIIQAVLQVHVQQAGPQPAAVKVAQPLVKAPVAVAAKPSTQAAQAPAVLAAKPAQVVQAPPTVTKKVVPAAAKVAKSKTTTAVVSSKQPSAKQAKAVSKHIAGLAQKKKEVKVEKKADAYAGFLSGFVA